MKQVQIRFTLNGLPVTSTVDARVHLVDFLREQHELSSPRVGCEHGVCGACTLRVDGAIVRGCLLLAAQVDGSAVETLEGLDASGEIADLQVAFHQRNAMQCGFCTAGMLMAGQAYLEGAASVSREAIREHLSGNYCRCTGYEAIVDAIETVAIRRGLPTTEDAS
jgi:aerobic carbon-monoxide dehydrogenase small subunit